MVLSRARRLAKASLDTLLSYMAQDTPPHWRTALLPPLAPLLPAFDVLIRYSTLIPTGRGAGATSCAWSLSDALLVYVGARLDEEVVGPLSSPYTSGTQALAQYRLGCKALRSAKLYRNTAAAHNQQVHQPHDTLFLGSSYAQAI